MPLSDNESSDDETDAFTTTNVLLGYASKEPTDDSFSQLGGCPKWLEPQDPPSAQLARCKICHRMMALILQLNGDLPKRFPTHDRRLYIFTCKSKTCRRKEGSIRAIRATRAAVQSPGMGSKQARSTNNERTGLQDDHGKKKPSQSLGNMLFNPSPQQQIVGSANPFSSSTTTSTVNPFSASGHANQQTPFSSAKGPSKPPSPPSNSHLTSSTLSETFAQKARLSSPPSPTPPTPREPWPSLSDFPPPYPSYHLDADFETLDAPHLPPSSTPSSSSARIMEIDDPPSSSSTTSKDADADAYESPSLDKTFRRFADRLAQNPMQVLRYEFGGSPLLYSKLDAVGKLLLLHSLPSAPTTTSNKKITTTITSAQKSGGVGMPRCGNCNAPRVFELQLTPQAIAELEAEEEMSLEGMDWGSVILGVCSRDCVPPGGVEGEAAGEKGKGEGNGNGNGNGKVGYVEEWIGVQWEEMGGGSGGGRR